MCCKNVSICYTNQMVCPGLWGHWYKYEDKYTAEFPILSYNQAARTHTSQQMSHTKLLSPRYLILWNKDLVADNKMQMYITFWRWHSLTWHNGKFIKPIVYENILYFTPSITPIIVGASSMTVCYHRTRFI